jgi:MarR family transcriptional regulator, lower aerobic nicotinate degradation pathway regulator
MIVTEPPDRLTGKPSWLVTQLATHAHRLASDAFAAADARGYHYRVLATLHEFGESSQIELARRCGMDRSDMVAVINELAEADQVVRTLDPNDRRRNLVTITKAGDRQLRRLDRVLAAVQDELVAPLSAADRQTFHRLLTQVLRYHQQRMAQ